jgi:2Fe-2S ferredoxin
MADKAKANGDNIIIPTLGRIKEALDRLVNSLKIDKYGIAVIRVDVPIGRTVMEAAKNFSQVSIPEIPADCYGCCACATCHIYVDEKWIDKLPKINDNMAELELLEYEKGYKEGVSRLGCQIFLTKELDGLIIHLKDNNELL